jgi:predicted ATPase
LKLLQLDISAHRGCPARQLQFSTTADGEPASLVAISGPSGSGKTTLLELVAQHKEHIAPYGRTTSADDVLAGGDFNVEVKSTWLLDGDEQSETGSKEARLVATSVFNRDRGTRHADPALAHVLGRYAHNPSWGKIDLWPAARISPSRRPSVGDPLLHQKQQRLAASSDKYASLGRLVTDAPAPRRAELAALLAELRPGLAVQDDATGLLRFETARGPRELLQLSTSERLAFELAATFVMVGLHHSVVLIDTPELGLPAGEAARTIGTLRNYAPTSQLVLATTDPGVLAMSEALVINLEAT